jgi:RNA polymerase sigma-70 factor (ECF subfamily)
LLGDRELAEDCVSETFSRLLKAVQEGRGPTENIQAYLYKVAHNWVNDHYRSLRTAAVPINVEYQAGADQSPVQEHTRLQEQEQLRAALFSLPAEQRRVIELRFLEEWSHNEVAQALGKSPEATRALQYRALSSLRRILIDHESMDANSQSTRI